jgi:hypothetical protein
LVTLIVASSAFTCAVIAIAALSHNPGVNARPGTIVDAELILGNALGMAPETLTHP